MRTDSRDDAPVTSAPAPELSLLLTSLSSGRTASVDHSHWDAAQWERALVAADWHRLAPLLFRLLGDDSTVPRDVRARLEARYLANVARNMFLRDALRAVLDALHAASIPAIPLKGGVLMDTVYPDAGLRELWDLDVLVPRDQLAAAEAAVTALGFSDDPSAYDREHTPRPLRAADHHQPGLVSADGLTAVELHHHITIRGEGRAFPIDDVWRRARPAAPFALASAPDDLLLHVAIHFTRNRLAGKTAGALAQIQDVNLVVEGHDIDWERFVASTHSYGLEMRAFLALISAAELGAAIPRKVLVALRPHGLEPSIVPRFLALRVLRADEHQALRPFRHIVLPRRHRLAAGWSIGADAWPSLARAYVRRVRRQTPQLLDVLRRPLAETISDHRLSGQISTLENRNWS